MIHPLTPAQVRIVTLKAEGLDDRDIAVVMGIGYAAVRYQLARIRAVMGVPTTVAAVATYVRTEQTG